MNVFLFPLLHLKNNGSFIISDVFNLEAYLALMFNISITSIPNRLYIADI